MSVSNTSNTVTNWDFTYPITYTTPTYTYSWHTCNCSNPVIVEKYQITCPNCETLNWAQLDEIVTCKSKKCGATLKATKKPVDYEIEVDD